MPKSQFKKRSPVPSSHFPLPWLAPEVRIKAIKMCVQRREAKQKEC